MKLSFVIPVYNSNSIIEQSYGRFKNVADKITKSYEIIFRDDLSSDGSRSILKGISNKDKKVHVFLNDKNYGLGYTLRNLFHDAKGEYIVYFDMDAPISFDLDLLPLYMEKIKGCDVLIASRYLENPVLPFKRWLASEFYYLINRVLFRIKLRDIGSGFVIFRKRVLDDIELRSDGFDIHIEAFARLQKNDCNIKEVPTPYKHWDGGSFNILKHGPKTLISTFRVWREVNK